MTDRTILITGANRGIGLELTEQFAADGWAVLACCRSPDDAEALRALGEQHAGIELHALDVTDYQQMKALSAGLRDRPIDILLSNAGIYGPRGSGFGEVDPAQWREVLEVNSIAPMMLVQCFSIIGAATAGEYRPAIGGKLFSKLKADTAIGACNQDSSIGHQYSLK
jgi:NAD(P)-dependent dehydrogenase (short-subunit alcohol dehydrogenase family)